MGVLHVKKMADLVADSQVIVIAHLGVLYLIYSHEPEGARGQVTVNQIQLE